MPVDPAEPTGSPEAAEHAEPDVHTPHPPVDTGWTLLHPETGLDVDTTQLAERTRAVLVGAALGDALGCLPSLSGDSTPRVPGVDALGDPDLLEERLREDDAHGLPTPLEVSAHTQLGLYTLDGLLEALEWAAAGQAADETACLWLAYLRWLGTQRDQWPETAPRPLPRWIDDAEQLLGSRSGGSTTRTALGTGSMGEPERPVLPGAMDAEVLPRSTILGLLPLGWRPLTTMAVNAAAITHGHPEAQVTAVAHALIVQATVTAALRGAARPVSAGAAAALEVLPQVTRPGEITIALLREAVERAKDPGHNSPSPGWSAGADAPQALAIGVWAAASAERRAQDPPRADNAAEHGGHRTGLDQFAHGLTLAVSHHGDRAATGAVAAALTGAALGSGGLPACWVDNVDVLTVVDQAASRWCHELGWASRR